MLTIVDNLILIHLSYVTQESGSVNTEGSPIIYKCVEDPVVRETVVHNVVMERPRTSPPVGGGSNTAEKGTANGKYRYIKKKLKRDGFSLHSCDASFKT